MVLILDPQKQARHACYADMAGNARNEAIARQKVSGGFSRNPFSKGFLSRRRHFAPLSGGAAPRALDVQQHAHPQRARTQHDERDKGIIPARLEHGFRGPLCIVIDPRLLVRGIARYQFLRGCPLCINFFDK